MDANQSPFEAELEAQQVEQPSQEFVRVKPKKVQMIPPQKM